MTTTTGTPGVGPLADQVRVLHPHTLPFPSPDQRSTFEVTDPATGEAIAHVAAATARDATRAVDLAEEAFGPWSSSAPAQRAEILHRAYTGMTAATEDLAALICAENGKAFHDAVSEVAYAAELLRWSAEEAVRGDGEYRTNPAGDARIVVTNRPVGIAALVTPWNFPAAMVTRKVGPALAAGCTAVIKPAAETPLTALALGRILQEAGLPAGAAVVVPTDDAAAIVDIWLRDTRVRKLSFTGSTAVGRLLLRQAADRVVNCSMELGGNAPLVVGSNVDVDAAVAGAMVAKFRNGGQACTAANRLFVHDDVLEEFTGKFGAAVAALRVGPAHDPTVQVGPLISVRAVDKVSRLVDGAVANGARVTHTAPVPDQSGGSYYPPTVLRDVRADAELVSTELFAPVAPLLSWTDERQLLAQINTGELGLAGYVFSRNIQWTMRLAERMEVGMVGINRGTVSDPSAPFGGIKQSGLGREGARQGLKAFEETQCFSVAWPT